MPGPFLLLSFGIGRITAVTKREGGGQERREREGVKKRGNNVVNPVDSNDFLWYKLQTSA